MSLQRKINSGIVQLRDTRASADGQTVTITETWTGPYSNLKTKQEAVWAGAKSTSLAPSDAGDGVLTIVRETGPSGGSDPPADVLELTWAELRLPVAENPAFSAITAANKKKVKLAAEAEDGVAPTDATELLLYNLLAAGTTEYAIGAPVVRRTRTLRTEPAGGTAWIRDDPPDGLTPSGYEWLKTANETRKEGRTYTHTEEWTGAVTWDATLYPEAP